MNKQGTLINGKVVGGIEWTKTFLPDGTERQGYTTNPVRGCPHGCRWTMPNGKTAICYARSVANGIASPFYPQGFGEIYWNPKELKAPASVKSPSKFFVGSMTDMFAARVPDDYIQQTLDMAASLPRHIFQFLTKNPKRLKDWEIPDNCWIGVSTPPDEMWGKKLTATQRETMLRVAVEALAKLREKGTTTFFRSEPLTTSLLPAYLWMYDPVDWVIIGAASDGPKYFPPEEIVVRELVAACDDLSVKLFFKGNLKSLPWAAVNWREEFPA